MIDGLKKLTDNLSDRADSLLALNVETYNLLHGFNVNGTGMIAADSAIKGTHLSGVTLIDNTVISGNKYLAKFYDTSNIICGYNGVAQGYGYYGNVTYNMYNYNPTSYRLFDINSLGLGSEVTIDVDQRVCGRAYASGSLDLTSEYGGTYVMLKKVDASFENESESATALTTSELQFHSVKYKNKFLNTWVNTNAYISWVTRANIYYPITVETRSYNPSSGAQTSTSSYQLPWLLCGGTSSTSEGEFIKNDLNDYSNIYFKHGDYLLMTLNLFGKRFLAVVKTTDNTIYYIDSDMLFLFGNIRHDVSIPGIPNNLEFIGMDGQYLPPSVYNLCNIVDFMQTSGYFHFIVRTTPNLYYYLRFAY